MLFCHGKDVACRRAGISRLVLTGVLALQLAACGGGGGGSSSGTGAATGGTADIASNVRISGSVGDGPVTGATIVVYSVNGDELGTMTSDRAAFDGQGAGPGLSAADQGDRRF